MENTINIGGGNYVPPENTKIIRGEWQNITKSAKGISDELSMAGLVKLFNDDTVKLTKEYRQYIAGAIIGLTKYDSCLTLINGIKSIIDFEIGKFGCESMAKALCTADPSLLKDTEVTQEPKAETKKSSTQKLKAASGKKEILEKYEKKWTDEGRANT